MCGRPILFVQSVFWSSASLGPGRKWGMSLAWKEEILSAPWTPAQGHCPYTPPGGDLPAPSPPHLVRVFHCFLVPSLTSVSMVCDPVISVFSLAFPMWVDWALKNVCSFVRRRNKTILAQAFSEFSAVYFLVSIDLHLFSFVKCCYSNKMNTTMSISDSS